MEQRVFDPKYISFNEMCLLFGLYFTNKDRRLNGNIKYLHGRNIT